MYVVFFYDYSVCLESALLSDSVDIIVSITLSLSVVVKTGFFSRWMFPNYCSLGVQQSSVSLNCGAWTPGGGGAKRHCRVPHMTGVENEK